MKLLFEEKIKIPCEDNIVRAKNVFKKADLLIDCSVSTQHTES